MRTAAPARALRDCLTANVADIESSLLSLLGEIPAAIFFVWLAVRLLHRD
jgi:hypothetical protein